MLRPFCSSTYRMFLSAFDKASEIDDTPGHKRENASWRCATAGLRPPATTRIPPVHSPIYHPIVRSQSSRAKAPPPPERNPISMSFRVSSHRAPIRSPEIQDLCFSEGPGIMGAKVATSDHKTHGQNSRSSYSSLVRPGRKSMSELRMSKDCWSHRILFGGPNNSRHMYAATEYHPNG